MAAVGLPARFAAAQTKYWESSPYRVAVELGVDDPSGMTEPEALADALQTRIDGVMRPLWETTLETAQRERLAACRRLEAVAFEELPEAARQVDKFLQLMVHSDAAGYRLQCREFDHYVRRWGEVQSRRVAQREFLAEACFQLLHATFAPLAEILPDEESDDVVVLSLKGAQLARGGETQLAPGDVLLPLLRRTTRGGELREDGVSVLPWTYLQAEAPRDARWTAKVLSGIRRPFGVRRRGLVQQVALVQRNSGGPTTVRFYSRTDPTAGLAGYEVFRLGADQASELVGVTDARGAIVLEPDHEAVTMLLLRSDGLLLAKVPVAVGAAAEVEVPIADDASRLRAQAELRTIREELIDLVAQRAILTARIRGKLKDGQIDDATTLMNQLNELPLQSTFDRRIDAAARAYQSADPAVQTRIDKLFSDTRSLLSRFLNVRQITELQAEVNAARQ
jgi:hypothetical protein